MKRTSPGDLVFIGDVQDCARGEGRADDTEETVKKRLEVYRRDTEAVLEHYGNAVHVIDGVGELDAVTARLLGAIGARP